MKRYLITGGTGFIGSAITKALLKQGHFVRVLDNNFRGSMNRLTQEMKSIDFVQGDIRELGTVMKACDQIDCIIHLAYINGTRYFYEQPEVVLDVAVKGITNILDAAIKNDVREFFLASSSEVYQTPPLLPTPEDIPLSVPDPYNPRYSYGGGKIISELMTIHFGKKYFDRAIVFRPHNVYGPDMGKEHVIPELLLKIKPLKGKKTLSLPVYGTGKETRAFVYIDDFVSGLLLLLEKGKHMETYNIGASDEVTIRKLLKTIEDVLEITISPAYRPLPDGSTKRRCPDITKLRTLGFVPKISLSEGIRKTAEWYLDAGLA